jgi:hypothetical protein
MPTKTLAVSVSRTLLVVLARLSGVFALVLNRHLTVLTAPTLLTTRRSGGQHGGPHNPTLHNGASA